MKKTLMFAALVVAMNAAFAADSAGDVKTVALKDGSTLYIFNDGKMAMADKVGQTQRMKPGHAMQAQDGTTINMVGDEVMRLDNLLRDRHPGG